MADIVLALDIATTTGWSFDDPERPGVPLSGSFRAPSTVKGQDGGRGMGAAFLAFEIWLRSKITESRATVLVYEAPLTIVAGTSAAGRFQTTDATIRLTHGYDALAECCAEAAGIPCFEKSVASVKKHFAGNGRATKEMVMMRCRQLGWRFEDDNSADAMALWSLSKSILDPKFRPEQFQLFIDGRAR